MAIREFKVPLRASLSRVRFGQLIQRTVYIDLEILEQTSSEASYFREPSNASTREGSEPVR